jgi:hypothetical protein
MVRRASEIYISKMCSVGADALSSAKSTTALPLIELVSDEASPRTAPRLAVQ